VVILILTRERLRDQQTLFGLEFDRNDILYKQLALRILDYVNLDLSINVYM